MTKMRKYNDMIDCTSLLYIEKKTELLSSIWQDMVYEVNHIG